MLFQQKEPLTAGTASFGFNVFLQQEIVNTSNSLVVDRYQNLIKVVIQQEGNSPKDLRGVRQ